MPAVFLRQLENLQKVAFALTDPTLAEPLTRQAEMILRASEQSIAEPADREDVQAAFELVVRRVSGEPLAVDE
jgi:uncharacterized membrane protein